MKKNRYIVKVGNGYFNYELNPDYIGNTIKEITITTDIERATGLKSIKKAQKIAEIFGGCVFEIEKEITIKTI